MLNSTITRNLAIATPAQGLRSCDREVPTPRSSQEAPSVHLPVAAALLDVSTGVTTDPDTIDRAIRAADLLLSRPGSDWDKRVLTAALERVLAQQVAAHINPNAQVQR